MQESHQHQPEHAHSGSQPKTDSDAIDAVRASDDDYDGLNIT